MNKTTEHQKIEKNTKNFDVMDIEYSIEDLEFFWNEVKVKISEDIRTIVWKAWIEPLKFLRYENSILYLSAVSYLMSTRVETQYYETIFFFFF